MKNWYVITGAPCSGKTTLLEGLKDRGYTILPEVARVYIDNSLEKGMSVETLRSNELKFQEEILLRKYSLEEDLDRTHTVFLDRGIPDSYAYFKLLGITDTTLLDKSISNEYKKVFILEPCPYKKDYARTESEEEQQQIHLLLQEAYKKAGATMVSVPVLQSKKERIDFVINNL